jgi:hypothetical protein
MIDYPRWMFHPTHEMRMVQNEEEEAALGPGWSRDIRVQMPPEEKPARRVPERYEPEPEPEPVFDPDEPDEGKPDQQPQERAAPVPARKKKRA